MANDRIRLIHNHAGNTPSDSNSENAFDPWALADDEKGYKLDKIYSRATDAQGHKEKVQVPLPPAIFGQLNAIVASGVIPGYRTPQDLVRDAVVHRLHYLAEQKKLGKLAKQVGSATDYEQFMCDIARMNDNMAMMKAIVKESEVAIDNCLATGDIETITETIESIQEHVGHIRDPFKKQVILKLRRAEEELQELQRRKR